MKQHITPDQLNELSEKERKSLFAYFDPKVSLMWMSPPDKYGARFQPTGHIYFDHKEKKFHLLPSIGQMIEFIDNETWWECAGEDKRGLCDMLWESVKEVLRK